jgi:hypothetical protein
MQEVDHELPIYCPLPYGWNGECLECPHVKTCTVYDYKGRKADLEEDDE